MNFPNNHNPTSLTQLSSVLSLDFAHWIISAEMVRRGSKIFRNNVQLWQADNCLLHSILPVLLFHSMCFPSQKTWHKTKKKSWRGRKKKRRNRLGIILNRNDTRDTRRINKYKRWMAQERPHLGSIQQPPLLNNFQTQNNFHTRKF